MRKRKRGCASAEAGTRAVGSYSISACMDSPLTQRYRCAEGRESSQVAQAHVHAHAHAHARTLLRISALPPCSLLSPPC
eukprot:3903641-Alexandrium_andersonii.AAC.1